jgi:hypothetical protein
MAGVPVLLGRGSSVSRFACCRRRCFGTLGTVAAGSKKSRDNGGGNCVKDLHANAAGTRKPPVDCVDDTPHGEARKILNQISCSLHPEGFR